MNNINQYKKRFYKLMESTIGDVKPLICEETESESGVSKKGSLKDIAKKKFNGKSTYKDVYDMTQKDSTEWIILSVGSGAVIAGSSKNLKGKIIKSSDFINLTNGGDVSLKAKNKDIGVHLWVHLGRDGSIECGVLSD
jgi:hypothetical protein